MKLLLVLETDWLKRYPHQHHHLLERLSLRGHEIHVFDYDVDWKINPDRALFKKKQVFKDVNKIYPGAKVQVIRPAALRLPVLEYAFLYLVYDRDIEKEIREFKPDIILGMGIVSNYQAARLAKKHHISYVFYWLDVLHMLIPIKPLRGIGVYMEKTANRNADQILTINRQFEEFLIGFGADPAKIKVIGAGIEKKRFDIGITGTKIRQQYGIADDDFVLLFMGWLYHFSGIKETALEIAKIKDKMPNIKFLLVGEGDAYNDMQEIIAKHGLQENVIMTGKQPYDRIPEFISASDICLLPAYPEIRVMQETVPIKVYEYMAMERTVISTKLAGVMKEFGEGNGVFYIDRPSDVINKAIELKNSGTLSQYGKIARNFAIQFDWDEITTEFEQTLLTLINKK